MRALILGISGQDGVYLARHLTDLGYEVHGTTRNLATLDGRPFQRVGVDLAGIGLHALDQTEFEQTSSLIDVVLPDEVYGLAGQSSVGASFESPRETFAGIATATTNVLEAIRRQSRSIRFCGAGSTECFGNVPAQPANESTPFRPRSPYAVAKVATYWQVANYRESYGLMACTAILSNHESPLRPERFVTQKIVRAACRIAAGEQQRLDLGRLDVVRDWGWAPEYVDAIFRMCQQQVPEDLIIATGQSCSLAEFVDAAFQMVDVDWMSVVTADSTLARPLEVAATRVDPSRAREHLGWVAKTRMPEVARQMVAARLAAE